MKGAKFFSKSVHQVTFNHRNRPMSYDRAVAEVDKRLIAAAGVWRCPVNTAFKTTADSTSRIRDKERVSRTLDYDEKGRDGVGIWSHSRISSDQFPQTNQITTGYGRIVYGDHGPYFEFRADQIKWENFPMVKEKSRHAYYDEAYLFSVTGHQALLTKEDSGGPTKPAARVLERTKLPERGVFGLPTWDDLHAGIRRSSKDGIQG